VRVDIIPSLVTPSPSLSLCKTHLFLPSGPLFAFVPAVRYSLSVQRRHVRVQLDGIGRSIDIDARYLGGEREGEEEEREELG
jgi:hypothetical protein